MGTLAEVSKVGHSQKCLTNYDLEILGVVRIYFKIVVGRLFKAHDWC